MKLRHRAAAVGAAAALAVAGFGVAATPAAASDEKEHSTIVIDGRTFGPDDGLTTETGEVLLGGDMDTLVTHTRGTTFAKSVHSDIIFYHGNAQAMANIYNGSRWIAAKYRYTRGSQDFGLQKSSASVSSSCRWSAGPEKKQTVADSLDPNAPQTKWSYGFSSVARGAC